MKTASNKRYYKFMVIILIWVSAILFCTRDLAHHVAPRQNQWPLTQLRILGLNVFPSQKWTGDIVIQPVKETFSDVNNVMQRNNSETTEKQKVNIKNIEMEGTTESDAIIYEKASAMEWPESTPPNNSVRYLLREELKQFYLHEKDLYRHIDRNEPLEKNPPADNNTMKKILYYNTVYHSKDFDFGEGNSPFIKSGCPYHNCFVTSNRSLVPPKSADAIIWHTNGFNQEVPSNLSSNTRLVLYMLESPVHTKLQMEYNNKFNYTMGYVSNSDIPLPYGMFVRKANVASQKQIKNYAEGKTEMAVLFSSNCHPPSKRELLVSFLSKHSVKIDTFGHCGILKCKKDKLDTNSHSCMNKVQKKYKFYLAFENSLCKDYMTEKFFKTMSYDILPVVYGLGKYEIVAPPHSFINAFDFPSISKLAEYLLYLDSNDTAYNEYFSWKNEYKVVQLFRQAPSPETNSVSWCNLCEKLHTDTSRQYYHNLGSFFSRNDSCLPISHPVLIKFFLS